MINRLRLFLQPPTFADEGLTRSARLLNTVLLAFTLMAVVGAPVLYAFDYFAAPEAYQYDPIVLNAAITTIVLNVVLLVVLHQGRVQEAGFVWTLFLFAIITAILVIENGIHNSFVALYIVLIMLAGLLLGQYAALLFSVLSIVTTFVIVYLDLNDQIMIPHQAISIRDWILYLFSAVLATFLLRFALQNLNDALMGLQRKNKELDLLRASLEERVKARTQALATSSEVSRRISTILDLDQLVAEVVERVQIAFNYYHVHIYLLDATGQRLNMVGGTGDAGMIMLGAGHALNMGQGLVGKAAALNEPVLVSDVREEPSWQPNELLPETKSETAVPIALGEEVVGVLDVQQNRVNGLTEDDTQLLQTIANQVAIAIQNARSFAAVQRQVQQESLLNNINRRIQQAATIENVLQVAAEELGQALAVQKTNIQLSNAIYANDHS